MEPKSINEKYIRIFVLNLLPVSTKNQQRVLSKKENYNNKIENKRKSHGE